jgi:Tol biopolymer transport system component
VRSATPTGGGAGQIVFSSNRGGDYNDIYRMAMDGSGLVRLTQGDSNFFAGPWSPDGQRILFTGFGLIHSYVGIMNADGSGQVDLSRQPDSDEGFPAWSPDGKRIAFTSRRDGNNEIYVMGADGSNPTRLTFEPGDDFAPTWSPDGKQIAFVSDRDQMAGIYDLYIMAADGSQVRRLTRPEPGGLTNDTAIDYSPAWSPDGTRIAFRSHHNGPADIYVINVDGSGLLNLTGGKGDNWSPNWSPDGTQIIFQTNRDGNWEIYLMNADGSQPRNLTNNPANDQMPFMQP